MQDRLNSALETSKKYTGSVYDIFKKIIPSATTLAAGISSHNVIQIARDLDASEIKDAIKHGASTTASWVNVLSNIPSSSEWYMAMYNLYKSGVWQQLSKTEKALIIIPSVLATVGAGYAYWEFGVEQHTLAACLFSFENQINNIASASLATFFTKKYGDESEVLPVVDPNRPIVDATGSLRVGN